MLIDSNRKRRFLVWGRRGDAGSYHIDQKIRHTAMAAVLNLRDILQVVVDGFDPGAFPDHELVKARHQLLRHLRVELRPEVEGLGLQQVAEFLGKGASVSTAFSNQAVAPLGAGLRASHLSWRQPTSQPFSLVIDEQRPLEAIQPIPRVLSSAGHLGEDLLRRNPTSVTDSNRHRIHERAPPPGPVSRLAIPAHRQQG